MSVVKVNYSLTDAESDTCDVTVEMSTDNKVTYRPVTIHSVDLGSVLGNVVKNTTSSSGGTAHWVKFYGTDITDVSDLSVELDQKKLTVQPRITITRDSTETIVAYGEREYNAVTGYSVHRTRDLGAAEARFTVHNEDGLFSPERQYSSGTEPNTVNYLAGAFNPLFNYANKVKVEEGLLKEDGTWIWTTVFTGWITTVNPTIDRGIPSLEVTSFDNMIKLIRYVPDNLFFTTDKTAVTGETLTTLDDITYASINAAWAEYPPPVIYLDSVQQEEDRYVINYVEGEVVFRTTISGTVSTDLGLTNDSGDGITWASGIVNWEGSPTPVVSWAYDEWQFVGATGGSHYTLQYDWVTTYSTLDPSEYTLNSSTGVVILNTALRVGYSTTLTVDADILDTTLTVASTTGMVIGDTIVVIPLGASSSDYEMLIITNIIGNDVEVSGREGLGDLEIGTTIDYYRRNNAIYSTFTSTGTVTADYSYGIAGTNEVEDIIRTIAENAGFTTADLTIYVSDEQPYTSDYTIYYSTKTNWATSPTPVVRKNGLVVSGYTIDYRNGTVTFTVANLEEDDIRIDYTHYGLQITEVTLESAKFDLENTENGFTAIQDIITAVAPNYVVYCNGDGVLIGEYQTQKKVWVRLTPYDGIGNGTPAVSSSSISGHDWQLTLEEVISAPVSDENLYTQVVALGTDSDPPNWTQIGSVTATDQSTPVGGGAEGTVENMIDYDIDTYWGYNANTGPGESVETEGLEFKVQIDLGQTRSWSRVDVLCGTYNGANVAETLSVEASIDGSIWYYPSKTNTTQSLITGQWATWENEEEFTSLDARYFRIKATEFQEYDDVNVTTAWFSSNEYTETHHEVSISEIQIWGKDLIKGWANLDECIIVGNGVKSSGTIPNVPYRVKNYTDDTYGWQSKPVTNVTIYKNDLNTIMASGTDWTLDTMTGIVTFTTPPADKDVICASYVLDGSDTTNTTRTAVFTNKALLQRVGLRIYKAEKDDGLETHLEAINRADDILPEVSRMNHELKSGIIYRPDIKIGHSVWLENEKLGVNRTYYVEDITHGFNGTQPSVSIALVNYL